MQRNGESYLDTPLDLFNSCPKDSQQREPQGTLRVCLVLILSCLVCRTFVIEAVLKTKDAVFDPGLMQPSKLSPVRRPQLAKPLNKLIGQTEVGVVQQTDTSVDDLSEYYTDRCFLICDD